MRFLACCLALIIGPLALAQSATPHPAEGTWTGLVTAPQGTTELTLRFVRNAEGKFDVTMQMPRMHTYNFTFSGAGEATADGIGFAGLNTRLSLRGDELVGTFGLSNLPVTLRRGGEFSAAPAAPTYPAAPTPLWTRSLGALTWAHPVVADGIVYVGTRDGKFHAAKVSDGTEVWTFAGTNRVDGRALVTDDAVLFIDGKQELVCLARDTGTLRWRFPLHDVAFTDNKPAPENPTFNRRVAIPRVEGNVVYCGSSDGGLYAIDGRTGTRLWRHDAKAPIFSGIARFDGDTLAFGTQDGSVVLFNPATRTETQRFKTGGGVVTTPLLVNGRVIVGSRDYMLYGFNRADGSVAWKFSYWFSWIESTPQLRDGVIYVGASDYRRVTAFDPNTGRELWGTDVGGMCWGWPAVTERTVYTGTVAQNMEGTVIRHTGGVIALDRRTGAVKWQHLSAVDSKVAFGGVAGSLAVAGDRVIGIGFDGVLTAWPVD